MAHTILKSLLPTEDHVDAFQRLCNLHINEMRAYDIHLKNVKRDPKTYHMYPAPSSHPDVMSAVIREDKDYNIEFEIKDDVTPPPATLDQKKQELCSRANSMLNDLQLKLFPPPLKLKLYLIEMSDMGKIPEEDRSKQQKEALRKDSESRNTLEKAHLALAKIESEIHDLTDKTIDTWKLPNILEIVK